MSQDINDLLLLICGDSASGKSASLEFIENPTGVMYLNCEAGKKLPFNSKFQEYKITDPYQVMEAFEVAETKPEVHTIVVDGLNYLMDMFESVHVIGAANTMEQWGAYGQFFRNLMQQNVSSSTKAVVMCAHVSQTLNEKGKYETAVPVKGAMKGKIESYFSSIVYAKRMETKDLKGFDNDMLVITEDEAEDEFKYVFQTRVTKSTIDEKMRGPTRLFSRKETYTDNNAQAILNHLKNFYS